jgi:hypothetical protein
LSQSSSKLDQSLKSEKTKAIKKNSKPAHKKGSKKKTSVIKKAPSEKLVKK